jgi:hypothetical protein
MSNYIVYLASGNVHNINECRYSLLKYLAVYNLQPPACIAIIVYTDAPAAFEAFAPFFKQFELKELRPPLPAKLEFIANIVSNKNGNFLYLDTDSYYTESVESIFKSLEEGSFLFYNQALLSDKRKFADYQKIKEHLSANTVMVDGEKISYLNNREFYSTEMIGVNSKTLSLVKKMADLYSKLVSQLPAPASEEFACTYYTTNVTVQTIQDVIASYNRFPEFKRLLQLFFKKNEEENIPNLVKLVHNIDPQTILQDKKQYDSQPFVKKLLSVLAGKAWSVRQYQNKF